MRIAVCDDSQLDLDMVCDLLHESFLQTAMQPDLVAYSSGVVLLDAIKSGAWYDVIFLDILMPVHLGIDVAHKLRQIGYDGEIVFLTATPDFAIESYDVNASGYLLKPVSMEKLERVVQRLIRNFGVETYAVKHRHHTIQIPLSDILYVESNNNRCILHKTDGTQYALYKRLDAIHQEIKDRRFLRCHQSFLVNMDHVRKVDKQFTMANGDNVLIRQRSLKNIRQQYYEYAVERRARQRL